MDSVHTPVLQKEVIEFLNLKPNDNFIDCTFGQGGHALAITERILPNGRGLGIDWSSEVIQDFRFKIQSSRIKNNLILVNENFVNLKKIVKEHKFSPVNGILLDLGLSSWHLEKSGRGFSFLKTEPLDMRYHQNDNILTAKEILNSWSEERIEKILREYGEERFARKIARTIIATRRIKPIEDTSRLVEIIKKAVPFRYQRAKTHFATRTFQSLRIAINNELSNLEETLPQVLEILEPEGRLAVISFHSLEDRIVKNFLKNNFKKGLLKILTKKPIRPSFEETEINPRSRSAKLRAAIKI